MPSLHGRLSAARPRVLAAAAPPCCSSEERLKRSNHRAHIVQSPSCTHSIVTILRNIRMIAASTQQQTAPSSRQCLHPAADSAYSVFKFQHCCCSGLTRCNGVHSDLSLAFGCAPAADSQPAAEHHTQPTECDGVQQLSTHTQHTQPTECKGVQQLSVSAGT